MIDFNPDMFSPLGLEQNPWSNTLLPPQTMPGMREPAGPGIVAPGVQPPMASLAPPALPSPPDIMDQGMPMVSPVPDAAGQPPQPPQPSLPSKSTQPAPTMPGTFGGGVGINPFEPTAQPSVGLPGPPMDIRSPAQMQAKPPAETGTSGTASRLNDPRMANLLTGLRGMVAPQVPPAQKVSTPSVPQNRGFNRSGASLELMQALGLKPRQMGSYDLPSTMNRALRG